MLSVAFCSLFVSFTHHLAVKGGVEFESWHGVPKEQSLARSGEKSPRHSIDLRILAVVIIRYRSASLVPINWPNNLRASPNPLMKEEAVTAGIMRNRCSSFFLLNK